MLRPDPCRASVLALIQNQPTSGGGITAREVRKALEREGKTFTRDAIYRTMRRLAAEGMLRWANRRFYGPSAENGS